MDLDKVNEWLGIVVQVRGEDIYRMKVREQLRRTSIA